VREAVELLAYELKTDDVVVTLDMADDIPPLWADGHQLHQVLVNLIANAHQAMRRQARPRQIIIVGRMDAPRQRVRLEVRDTGPGIRPELQPRIFEAFFTTKPPGEGTGLGLSLCRNIVDEHGGTMTLESLVDAGTTFTIDLPIVAPPPESPDAAVAATPAPVTSCRVLVVEDEPSVAEAVAEALGDDGHQADIAGNGAIALQLLDRHTYDLVISDTKMPVLDGESFYGELERRFPQLRGRIIFLTGDVLSLEKREFLARSGAPFLMKPFDLDELRQTVQRTLAGTPSGG